MKAIFVGRSKVLAPLVGGSDLSFRLLARKYGAEITYTEMCVAEYYLNKGTKQCKQYTFEFDKEVDRPLILQLAGNSSGPIIEMANLKMFEGCIDGVDINCGCPQSFALEKGYGSALLRDPASLVKMCKEIVENIKYPLSVKLRLHESVDKTISIIKDLKEIGVKAFAVHARYYWQKGDKRGIADWDAIKKIRETFPDVYLIGNGNIGEFEDFDKMIKETGVHAGMAGYGALVKPYIFSQTTVKISDCIESYLNIARKHVNKLIDIQRHLEWMLKTYNLTPIQKGKLFQCSNLEEIRLFLLEFSIVVHLEPIKEGEEKVIYPKSFPSNRKEEKRQLKRARREEAMLKKPKFNQASGELSQIL